MCGYAKGKVLVSVEGVGLKCYDFEKKEEVMFRDEAKKEGNIYALTKFDKENDEEDDAPPFIIGKNETHVFMITINETSLQIRDIADTKYESFVSPHSICTSNVERMLLTCEHIKEVKGEGGEIKQELIN